MRVRNYVTLGDVCEKGSSNIAQKDLEQCDGEYPVFGASGWIKNVSFFSQEKEYIAIVKDGAGIGRTMLLPAFSSVIGTMQYIFPNEKVDIRYLYYVLNWMNLAKYYSGATIPHIYFKDYKKEQFPLQPLEEQRRIAAVLDKVCDLIALRHKQLERLDLMVKARFVEMFGDQYTNKKDWLIVNLEELFSISSSKRIYQDEQSRTGIPFFRISDLIQKISTGKNTAEIFIPMEKYEELKRLDLVPKSGDILITSRGTLGKCYVVSDEDKFYFQDGMISWLYNRDKRITVTYIVCLFEMPWFRKQIDDIPTGTTVNYLSIERLKKLKIMLPDIKTQKNFSDFVTEIDKLKLPIQRSLDTLEVLKKSLMQEYFGQGV